jgi:hypothetical protein
MDYIEHDEQPYRKEIMIRISREILPISVVHMQKASMVRSNK